MEGGESFSTFCVTITPRVCPETTYQWVHEFPCFAEAKRIGEKLGQQFWERLAKSGAAGQLKRVSRETISFRKNADGTETPVREIEHAPAQFNATMTLFMLKNKAPKDFRDRRELEVTGKEGGPVQYQNMDKEKRKSIIKKLTKTIELSDEDDDSEAE
jgi:hypothetical protein